MTTKKVWRMTAVYCAVIVSLLIATEAGSRAVTTLSETAMIDRGHCIVIDPGHGGEDGGAVSRSGLPESSFNLAISLKLNDLLNILGYDTKMIRKTDISIYTKGETLSQKKASDLKERVNLINNTENAVVLSIHQNHYPDDRYRGAQVFYAKTDGSEQFAKTLQDAFVATVNPGSSRKSKKCSGVYLMEHIKCPGILIECGFLSNAAEEAMLNNPEYQKKLCSVIATATCNYLSNT